MKVLLFICFIAFTLWLTTVNMEYAWAMVPVYMTYVLWELAKSAKEDRR